MSSKRNGARVVVAATVAVLAGAGAVWPQARGPRPRSARASRPRRATSTFREAVAARPSRSPGATPGRPGPQAHRARPDRKALPARPGPPVSPGEAPPRARRSPTARWRSSRRPWPRQGAPEVLGLLQQAASRGSRHRGLSVGLDGDRSRVCRSRRQPEAHRRLAARLGAAARRPARVRLARPAGEPPGDQARDGSAHKWSARIYVMCV